MEWRSLVRKIILAVGDVGCIYAAYELAKWAEGGRYSPEQLVFHNEIVGILIVMMFVFFNVYGLFSILNKRITEIILNLLVAVMEMFVIAMAVTFFARHFAFSRVVIIYAAFFTFVLLAFWLFIMHKLEFENSPRYSAVIFADDSNQIRLEGKLKNTLYYKRLTSVHFAAQEPNTDRWREQMNEFDLVIIDPSLTLMQRDKLMKYAVGRGKRVIILPTLYELCCRKMPLFIIDDLPAQRVQSMTLTFEQRLLKRALCLL